MVPLSLPGAAPVPVSGPVPVPVTANVDAGCQPGAGDVDMNRTSLQRLKEKQVRQYARSICQYEAVRTEKREAKADRRNEGRVAESLEEGEEEEDERCNPWQDAGDDDAGCQPGAAGDVVKADGKVDVQRLKAEMKRDPHRFWREARGKGAGDEDHGDEGDEGHPGEDSDEDRVHEGDEGEDSDPAARKIITTGRIISLLEKMERARKLKNAFRHVDVVEMLDRAGLAHVRDRSKDWTALHHAVEECKRQKTSAPHLVAVVAKVLAADPTLIDAKTQGSRPPQNTALHLASKGHYHDAKKVVGMLLQARADPAAVDNRQCTPIMMAASTANAGAFEVLLEALDDATAKAKNVDGRDAPPID